MFCLCSWKSVKSPVSLSCLVWLNGASLIPVVYVKPNMSCGEINSHYPDNTNDTQLNQKKALVCILDDETVQNNCPMLPVETFAWCIEHSLKKLMLKSYDAAIVLSCQFMVMESQRPNRHWRSERRSKAKHSCCEIYIKLLHKKWLEAWLDSHVSTALATHESFSPGEIQFLCLEFSQSTQPTAFGRKCCEGSSTQEVKFRKNCKHKLLALTTRHWSLGFNRKAVKRKGMQGKIKA